jgi:hypothetical protein
VADSGQQVISPGVGGIDKTIYRLLTITQPKNKTCVWDWYGRLALGSHLFPGSSLHANVTNSEVSTSGIGARDVSIPVNEIEPQELSKDMAATQDQDHVWNLTKELSGLPGHFTDTCDEANRTVDGVTVRIEWERLPAEGNGDVTIVTNIYAKNPAAREVTLKTLTDDIYWGGQVRDTATASNIDIPAHSETLVLTHTTAADPAFATDIHDVATATYKDKVTNIDIPGSTTAEASATIEPSGLTTHETATIKDTESIDGTGLTFSVDEILDGSASGSFTGGYTLGDHVTGPLEWVSDEQSGDGFVEFHKSIHLSGPIGTEGTLSDTAELDSAPGVHLEVSREGNVDSTGCGTLEVVKHIVPAEGDDGRFELSIGSDLLADDVGNNGSTGAQQLDSGNYSVSEQAGDGTDLAKYDSAIECRDEGGEGDVVASGEGLSLEDVHVGDGDAIVCVITNTRRPGKLTVVKHLLPEGDGGLFDLLINRTIVANDASDGGSGSMDDLAPGDYTVSEAEGTGTSLDDYSSSIECRDDGGEGDVVASGEGTSLAGVAVDSNDDIVCTITNTLNPASLEVTKTEGGHQPVNGWTFTLSGDSLDEPLSQTADAEDNTPLFDDLAPGDYTLCETDIPSGWYSSLANADGAFTTEGGDVCVNITLSPGEDAKITVDNVQPAIHVEKTVRVGSSGAFSDEVSAHVGDTLEYHFEVTNTGNIPLAVSLADDRCDAAPEYVSGDTNDDDLLAVDDEVWIYKCSHAITSADLAAGPEFPNVAIATGTFGGGEEGGGGETHSVTDDDPALAHILDPKIHVEKLVAIGSGGFADSQTAEVGDTATYQLTVTNTGNTPLTVVLTDPRCDSAPVLQSGDANSDGKLDLTESWVYTCTHVVTSSDPDPLVNTATAVGTDEIGGTASDDDTATVDILPPVGGTLPETVVSGRAVLAGKTGCVARSFTARVSGRAIAKVVFRIDGRKVKTVSKPDKKGRFNFLVNPRKYKTGAHRLEATVTFDKKSGTRAKKLRLAFLRCARKVAPPRFTG